MSTSIPVPEGEIAKRPLQFFWIVDHSGSMAGKKMAMLNQAIREAIPQICKAVAEHPQVQIMMRAIKFSDIAAWHIGPSAVPVEKFIWSDLGPTGSTSTAKALRLLASELTLGKMPRRAFPPVCILISDGYCTEKAEVYDSAIAELLNLPWGARAVKMAIGVGDQADYDENELLKFVSHKEVGVLKADNPEKLIAFIVWSSVAASVGASSGKSAQGEGLNDIVTIPPPPVFKSGPTVF